MSLVTLFPLLLVIANFASSPNKSFVLNGRIVDDRGFPASGVRVSASLWYDASLIYLVPGGGEPARKDLDVVTGVDGRFKLSGQGHSLGIDISKIGWHTPPDDRPLQYNFMIPSGVHGYTEKDPLVYRIVKDEISPLRK